MRTLGFVIVTVGALAINATATTQPAPSVPAASPQQLELSGRIRSTRAEWRGARIITRVTLEADATGNMVEFDVPGGTIDEISMVVSGMPRFDPGEHAHVLLRATPAGLFARRSNAARSVQP